MLSNGLGELLHREAPSHSRFVDLFCGSGAVSWFVAKESRHPVLAVDIQEYGVALARAVIGRTSAVRPSRLKSLFVAPAQLACQTAPYWREANGLDSMGLCPAEWTYRARRLCSTADSGVIFRAYGGHYYSPSQAIALDALMRLLPVKGADREVCLAALLIAASDCAAAPGHTAQPFQPTKTAGTYIQEAWNKDIFLYVCKSLVEICALHAQVRGTASVDDALAVAASLARDDLVFLDPPYAGVHYSRFYHVLETIARGRCGAVSGVGRYPPPEERPASAFSRKGESRGAFERILWSLSKVGCTVIVTFPAGECSNGLSGQTVLTLAERHFRVECTRVDSRFSTLGGNNLLRSARTTIHEMILLLRPANRTSARAAPQQQIGRARHAGNSRLASERAWV